MLCLPALTPVANDAHAVGDSGECVVSSGEKPPRFASAAMFGSLPSARYRWSRTGSMPSNPRITIFLSTRDGPRVVPPEQASDHSPTAATAIANAFIELRIGMRRIITSRMEPWLRDIRLAVRRLRLAPGFTVFAIASLAIGIGVSTAIYSAVRTLFWMPMGISDPERVMSWTVTGRVVPAMSWPDFLDVRAQQSSFASIAAARRMAAAVSIGTTVETVFGESVSGEYFETLGLTPRRGRLLHAQDEAGRARVAVVSESFWRTRLAGDSAVIGRLFKLGGETFEIVGVVSGTFHGVHAMLPSSIW